MLELVNIAIDDIENFQEPKCSLSKYVGRYFCEDDSAVIFEERLEVICKLVAPTASGMSWFDES